MSDYNALHHALVYSYVVKAVAEIGGEGWEEVVKKATVNYGRSRGHRMALRCDHDGFRHDVMGYTAYGEWRQIGNAPKGKKDFTAEVPYSSSESCPWYDAWEAEGQMEYGKHYCKYVDESIGEGFFADKPEMRLVTKGTRTNGADRCLFTYTGGTYTADDVAERDAQAAKLGTKALMGWEFHIGHVYYELEKQIKEDMPEKADAIIGQALAGLEARFGKDFVQMVLENAKTDFSTIEGYEGV